MWTYDTNHRSFAKPSEAVSEQGQFALTEKGKQYFKTKAVSSGIRGMDSIFVSPQQKPYEITVASVDGITDAAMGLGKVVQYTWRYAGVPEDATRCLAPRRAQALIKQYDDGWRVERAGNGTGRYGLGDPW